MNHIDCSVRNHEHECLPSYRCKLLGPLQADGCNTPPPHVRPPSPTCNTKPFSLAQKPTSYFRRLPRGDEGHGRQACAVV